MSPAMSTIEEKEHDGAREDRISELSDDMIFTCVLSLLPLKDLTRTSTLSTRWRYLFAKLTTLDFDGSETVAECKDGSKSLDIETAKFVSWVNGVMSMNLAPSIDVFRVCFALDASSESHIDKWVEFAISRDVKKLELDFTHDNLLPDSFPYDLQCHVFKEISLSSSINSLKSLSLKYGNISGSLVELLLSRFHNLERLVLEESYSLDFLKVKNSSRSLKYLTIINCNHLLDLEVDSMDLISLEIIFDGKTFVLPYHRVAISVHKKVPSLLRLAHLDILMRPTNINFIRGTSDALRFPREGGISSLKSLYLQDIYMRGEFIEWLLSQCHFLERLVVIGSKDLVQLKVASPLGRLKFLKIQYCSHMEKLEIDIVNVMAFKLNGNFSKATLVPTIGFPSLLNFAKFTENIDLDLYIEYRHEASANGISSLKLKSLDFTNVKVSGEIIGIILSRCQLLEKLTVVNSSDLLNLKITESSAMLKHLVIHKCKNIKQLELQSTSLVSFEFGCDYNDNATNMNVVCNNTNTSLVEAYFHGNSFLGLRHLCKCFSTHLSKLSLEITEKIPYDPVNIPVFDNVKWLKLIVTTSSHKQLDLRYFPEACPLLQEFHLQIDYYECECRSDTKQELDSMNSEMDSVDELLETEENESNSSCSTLPHLTKLEWVGLGAYREHVDDEYSLALHIIKNATMLEKFICDTRYPLLHSHDIFDEVDKMEQIKAVRKLAKLIPSKVQVVVI